MGRRVVIKAELKSILPELEGGGGEERTKYFFTILQIFYCVLLVYVLKIVTLNSVLYFNYRLHKYFFLMYF